MLIRAFVIQVRLAHRADNDPVAGQIDRVAVALIDGRHAAAPESWEAWGGPAVVMPVPGGAFVVHDPQVHDQIAFAMAAIERWHAAPDETAPFWLTPDGSKEHLLEKLARPVSLDVLEMRLRDVLGDLAAQADVPIIIDGEAVSPDLLIVSQTRSAHEEIEPFLANLRRAMKRPASAKDPNCVASCRRVW